MSAAITGLEFGSRVPIIENVMCNGSESRLQDCPGGQPTQVSSECTNSSNRAAGVRCSIGKDIAHSFLTFSNVSLSLFLSLSLSLNLSFHWLSQHNHSPIYTVCYPGSVRLAGGENRAEGRVEVCKDNTWGTVCDIGWDERDVEPACRSAGFYWGLSIYLNQPKHCFELCVIL